MRVRNIGFDSSGLKERLQDALRTILKKRKVVDMKICMAFMYVTLNHSRSNLYMHKSTESKENIKFSQSLREHG